MKTRSIFYLLLLIIIAACSEKKGGSHDDPTAGTLSSPGDDTAYISIDTANRMIQSYLTSINAPNDDSSLRSVIIDANALRNYLNGQRNITHMKIMMAHQQSYINSGREGQNCGYSDAGLTFVLAGIDSNENYVYLPNNMVQDRGDPCPNLCEVQGTAQSDLLPRPR